MAQKTPDSEKVIKPESIAMCVRASVSTDMPEFGNSISVNGKPKILHCSSSGRDCMTRAIPLGRRPPSASIRFKAAKSRKEDLLILRTGEFSTMAM
jgi:hypothetical protein